MAFHPFQSFRKRQKALLAILTIFVMFIFILQMGIKGDPLDRLMSFFGASRNRGDKTEVTKLYNKEVTVGDLDQLRHNRLATDVFIQRATAPLYLPPTSLMQDLMQGRQPAGLELNQTLKLFKILDDAGFNPFRPAARDYGKLTRDLARLKAELALDNKTDGVKAVQRLINGTGLERWAISHRGDLYFGGNLTTDGLLDFLIWRQQADRLNITLTDADVRNLVNHEADTHEADSKVLTGDDAKDADKISAYLAGVPKAPKVLKDFYEALRTEFRVRLAQEALLGSTPGARAGLGAGFGSDQFPAGSTPEQFFEFFKDRRTTLNVAFLKVPVSQFTGQVKEEPTEPDLKKLYERSKEDEPDPLRERFGFKVPRRVKVEWVTTDPESKYYRKLADEKALPLLAAVRPLMGAGGPASYPALAAAVAADLTPKLEEQAEYAAYVSSVKSWWDATPLPALGAERTEREGPYATGLRRADTVAAVVGQALGAAGTNCPPWTARLTLALAQAANLAEQKERAVSITLAGASPFLPGILAQEAAYVTVPVASFDAVRGAMAARAREHLARDMARGALDTLTKDVAAKHFNPKEAADYVLKNANPEHGIVHGAMTEARDVFAIADDPALAPLRQAAEGKVPFAPSARQNFASQFFPSDKQRYQPQQLRGSIDFTGPTYYFWLTENDPAYVPSFDEARPKILDAWKFQKARKLAEDEAQRIIDAVQHRPDGTSPERFLKDEAARLGYETFDVLKLAKLFVVPQVLFGSATQYRPFEFTETQFANPRPDTVEKLFQDLKEPGDGTVVKDRPDRNDYVAVLLKKPDVPTQDEFFTVYAGAGNTLDSLWSIFQSEREEQFRSDLLKQLRVEARAPLDTQGQYRIDPEVRKRLVSSRSDSEE